VILTGPQGGAIKSSSFASALKCSRSILGIPGNVLALHPHLGHAPYASSSLHSATVGWTNAGGNTGSDDDRTWMSTILGWLADGGASTDPYTDPDLVKQQSGDSYYPRRYTQYELKATVGGSVGGSSGVVYDHVVRYGKHTAGEGGPGLSPGTVVHEYYHGYDTQPEVMDWITTSYELHDDGTFTGEKPPQVDAPSTSVNRVLPLSPPGWWGVGHYTDSISETMTIGRDRITYLASYTSDDGQTLTIKYELIWSDGWGLDEIQAELDWLLDQVNLSSSGKQYDFGDGVPRVIDPAGEYITVYHDGPYEGVPLKVVFSTLGPGSAISTGILAQNVNDVVYAAGEAGTPPPVDLTGSEPWAKMKSVVALPPGSFTKTIKTYTPPKPDTTAFPGLAPNNDHEGGLESEATESLPGGTGKRNYPPGAWITITKVEAA
jgi:hypothetical protein